MLILRSSPPSPFGRKVKIALAITGRKDQVEVVATDTVDINDSIRTQNPLGKIPTLILEDGTALFDSRVILEYLNEGDAQSRLIPPGQRLMVLRQQALADGLMDAALLQVYERRYRPAEHVVQSWLDMQQGKVQRALDFAEANYSAPGNGTPHVGEIALACALGYLDLRFAGSWRTGYPKLVAWLDSFAARTPSYGDTAVHP